MAGLDSDAGTTLSVPLRSAIEMTASVLGFTPQMMLAVRISEPSGAPQMMRRLIHYVFRLVSVMVISRQRTTELPMIYFALSSGPS